MKIDIFLLDAPQTILSMMKDVSASAVPNANGVVTHFGLGFVQ